MALPLTIQNNTGWKVYFTIYGLSNGVWNYIDDTGELQPCPKTEHFQEYMLEIDAGKQYERANLPQLRHYSHIC
ncbi:hypothetical protein KFU94_03230 [Chloroflexi bacterium TSY]|nr:hypothetical protein [Chloroflexi bacterium TSY]